MNIGKLIRETRIKKGLTQVDLAKLIDCSDRSINHIEKRRMIGTPALRAKISRVLEIDLLTTNERTEVLFSERVEHYINGYGVFQVEASKLSAMMKRKGLEVSDRYLMSYLGRFKPSKGCKVGFDRENGLLSITKLERVYELAIERLEK